MTTPGRVPTLVLGGYLGAGKTTLVNHLLRHADGRRIAVLVNDFGELSIDADLIEGADGQVLALAGGCVCCSFGDDLLSSLNTVLQRQPRPDVVLIECSGVGLPASVARTAQLCLGLVVQGVVGVLDADTVRERAADAYVGDTVCQQLHQADLLLLNKTDLLPAAALVALQRWLATHYPATPVLACTQGQVPAEVVLGLQELPRAEPACAQPLSVPKPQATHTFQHEVLALPEAVDVPALAAQLTATGSGVLRAKGYVWGLDGQHWLLHTVGRRADITPWPQGKAWPGSKLLVIRARAA